MSQKVDILVVGAGIAGLLVALELKQSRQRFLLLEAESVPAARTTGGTQGLVLPFAMDNPARLTKSFGDEASSLLNFYQKNLERFRALCAAYQIPINEGAYLLPASSHERAELCETESLFGRAYARFGKLPLPGNPEGLELFDAFTFSLSTLVQALQEELQDHLFVNAKVLAFPTEKHSDIETTAGTYQADVVILCCNAYTPLLCPEWKKYIFPVRAQSFTASNRILEKSVVANYGHEIYSPVGDRTWMGGINPTSSFEDLTYDQEPTEEFQNFMEKFFQQRLGEKPSVLSRHAAPLGMTSTGLPFIGPLPGRVDRLLFAGFSGRGLSYVAEGASELTELLLYGKSLPPHFAPRGVRL